MKFLVDVKLPKSLALWLSAHGHATLHTLDLPQKNRTPDADIVARAELDGCVVVSKDADFVQSFLISGKPRLLLVSTGNISNLELEALLHKNIPDIVTAFAASRFVEITREALITHE